MNFETAKEYIEYLDEQTGESWSNSTDELADIMEDYAKMYHIRQLKLLNTSNIKGLLPLDSVIVNAKALQELKDWAYSNVQPHDDECHDIISRL